MTVVYPRNAMMRKLADPIFEAEYDAAREAGFSCLLWAEDLVDRDGWDTALASVPNGDGDLLYRGWIMPEERYRQFHAALASRGWRLVSTPDQYAAVTYLPNYHPKIAAHAPPAVWTNTADPYQAWLASRTLGDGPFVLKDHVKSAKHRWDECCFVPKGVGRDGFEAVARNLLAEQGAAFHRGFVVKQYVPLRVIGDGPRAYPQCEEYRLFFWRQRLLVATHYHDRPTPAVDWSVFERLVAAFESSFFTMDVARMADGRWLVIDMGAGECSSLPPSLPPAAFYQALGCRMADANRPHG